MNIKANLRIVIALVSQWLLLTSLGAQTILYTFHGAAAGDRLGRGVSTAGDVNGDGVPDLIAGAQLASPNGPFSGQAQVFSGSDGTLLFTFPGDATSDFAGFGVSGAGDINADGFDDVIVGAFGDDNTGFNSGSARVYSGRDGSVLHFFNGLAASDNFGSVVGAAGDVNGDGFSDVIVSAAFADVNGAESGSVYVISGLDGTTLWTFQGNSAGDLFGVSAASAGDVNRDGVPDFIIGAPDDAPNGSKSGSATVYSGADGAVLFTFAGITANERLGRSASGAGDVNGDGFPDLIVGAPNDSGAITMPGRVQVFSGRDGAVLLNFSGQAVGDFFGVSVSGAGDVNGDGFADLVIGASGADANGIDSGAAFVYSGRDGRLLFSLRGAAGDRLGGSVSGAGDIDGDGLSEVILGAYQADSNGVDAGTVVVVSIASATELAANLIELVVTLNLQKGIANSLDAKLESAMQALEDVNEHNDLAAVNALNAFIQAVEAQRGKQISESDAALLIASAQDVVRRIAGD